MRINLACNQFAINWIYKFKLVNCEAFSSRHFSYYSIHKRSQLLLLVRTFAAPAVKFAFAGLFNLDEPLDSILGACDVRGLTNQAES